MTPLLAYLLQRGVPRAHALGMLANVGAESGGNPAAVGDNGSSYGLLQHHGPRRDALFSHAGTRTPSAQQQIDFALSEPETTAYLAQSFPDSRAAAEWFATHWERPKAEYLAQRKAGWQPGSVQDFEQRIMAQIPGAGPLLASTDTEPAYPPGLFASPEGGAMNPYELPPQQPQGLFEQLAAHPLFNMGLGVLGANTGHYGAFAPALGRGAMLGMESFRRSQEMQQQQQQNAMQAQVRQAQMLKAQQAAQKDEEMARGVEAWIETLPPKWQKLARIAPEHVAREMAKELGGGSAPTYSLKPELETDEQGNVYAVQYGSDASIRERKLDRKPFSMESRTPEFIAETARARTEATLNAKQAGEFEEKYGEGLAQIDAAKAQIEEMAKLPGRQWATGTTSYAPLIRGTDAWTYSRSFDRLKGMGFLANIQQMRGLGQLSDAEGKAIKEAFSELDLGQPEKDHEWSLAKIYANLERGRDRLQTRKALGRDEAAKIEAAREDEIAAMYQRLFGRARGNEAAAKAPAAGSWSIKRLD